MNLIDKDALVEEIIELDGSNRLESLTISHNEDYKCGYSHALEKVRDFIDTLELKEVDLDTDFGVYWGEYCDCGGNINDYNIALHFFELGLKTQKGE